MYEEYLEKLKEEGIIRNRKEGTIQTYTANVNKFLNWANKNPEELTLDDCRNYIWDLRVNCKFSTQHCNGVNSALKFFFRYVLRKPWEQDIVPRMINDIVLPGAITLEEVKQLIDSATLIRNKAIIALLYSSGLRVSELCRLEFGVSGHGATKLKNHYEFKELLNKLFDEDWVVYTKEAFNGAKSVIKYLGNYTHRSAISNKRIVAMDDATVTYMAKDYTKECPKYEPMTIAGTEFIRRFLMHVLPKGFVRIRHYGLLSCRCKKDKMTLCRNLLGCEQYISRLRGKKVEEKMMILYNVDICKCKECGEPLRRFRVDGRYMLC